MVFGSHFDTWGLGAAGSNLRRAVFERFLKKVRWWVMGSLPYSGWTDGAAQLATRFANQRSDDPTPSTLCWAVPKTYSEWEVSQCEMELLGWVGRPPLLPLYERWQENERIYPLGMGSLASSNK